MPALHKDITLPHKVEELFSLVSDIEKYPEFLPWCRSVKINSSNDVLIEASIEIARGAYHHSFSTLNHLQKNRSMEMQLLEGPFRHFRARWRFEHLDQTYSKIILDLDYEFSSRLMGLVAGRTINHIAETLVTAICQRADIIYGEAN